MSSRFSTALYTLRKTSYLLVLSILSALALLVDFSKAEELGSYELPQEKELYNTSPNNFENDSILDATNPMDLINRLRRATALDNATSPSDAVDDALKALEKDFIIEE